MRMFVCGCVDVSEREGDWCERLSFSLIESSEHQECDSRLTADGLSCPHPLLLSLLPLPLSLVCAYACRLSASWVQEPLDVLVGHQFSSLLWLHTCLNPSDMLLSLSFSRVVLSGRRQRHH